jgi:hypothetical protein
VPSHEALSEVQLRTMAAALGAARGSTMVASTATLLA